MEHVCEELQGSAGPQTPFQEPQHSEYQAQLVFSCIAHSQAKCVLLILFFKSLVCHSVWISSGDEAGGSRPEEPVVDLCSNHCSCS